MSPSDRAAAFTARQRHQLAGVLLVWALFIVNGSWVPLNFQPRDLAEAWTAVWQWSGVDALKGQRLDTAVNVLLTVPLGFGLALLGLDRSRRAPALVRLGIVLAVLPLSLAVELGQAFLPSRSESLGDVAAQTVGTLIGLVLQAWLGRRAQLRLVNLMTALDARSRARHLLHLYLLALLLFNVMPLDLTLDAGELYGKWRDGRVLWLPFSGPWTGAAQFTYDLVTDILLWMPVGALWRLDEPRRKLAAIAWRAALLALGIELAQLFVLSRVTDISDVLTSTAGAWLGAAGVLPSLRALGGDAMRWRRMAAVGLWLWLLVTLMVYGWPFAWHWPAAGGLAFVDAFTRVPFVTYFQRNEFGALNEILRKLLVFLPGGLLLRLWSTAPGLRPSRSGLLALCVLAFLLEAGQVVLADRVADLTDALLACLGATLGWVLSGWLQGMRASLPLSQAPTPLPPPRSTRAPRAKASGASVLMAHGLTILVLATLLWLLARLPGVPYNVVKLMPIGLVGWASAAGLALAAWWLAALPVAAMVVASRRVAMALPAWLLLHALVAFAVLRLMVPLPMLHKVIGSPVLALSGPWEDLLRYLALHVALLLPLCGGALVVQVLRQPAALARLLYWLLLVALLAWPLHWAVVDRAATDNLVELMRGGGSLGASAWLATAVMAVGAGAGALACLMVDRRQAGMLLGLLVIAAAVTAAALVAGLEPMLVKYDKAFSALQFILSASRQDYASGTELLARAALAFIGVVAMLAWLQLPWWRRAPQAQADRPPSVAAEALAGSA